MLVLPDDDNARLRRNARQIPALRFCAGCDTSVLAGHRGEDSACRDADGRAWHLRCWRQHQEAERRRLAERLPRVAPSIDDLYD